MNKSYILTTILILSVIQILFSVLNNNYKDIIPWVFCMALALSWILSIKEEKELTEYPEDIPIIRKPKSK
jgi:hypothetical protein